MDRLQKRISQVGATNFINEVASGRPMNSVDSNYECSDSEEDEEVSSH